MDIKTKLSRRIERMDANVIREILKVVGQPGMISLAGGIPAPASFPMEQIQALTELVWEKYGTQALQYDATEGFMPLREALVGYLNQQQVQITSPEEVIVFSGSQSILDTVAKILITPGDKIAIESPSYLGAISAFNPYEPEYAPLATDNDGVIPEALEAVLKTENIKFIYLVPTFQNPTGRTLPLERRQRIAQLIQQYDAILVEDDPYSALRYRGEALPPIHSFAPEHVIYNGTFSKILAPGLRIGYSVAPAEIRQWLVIAKQGADLHANTLGQAIAAEYVTSGYLEAHLPHILNLYGPRQAAMLEALDRSLPEGFEWTQPEGGMFMWVEGPAGLDCEALYWECVKRKVAFVPGKYFHADHSGEATMRLNFTMVDEATIQQGSNRQSSATTAE